jgi:hypothetical protein
MDRMPSPKRPIVELTPRNQLLGGVGILALSYALGALIITSEPPRQATEFTPNFDSAPVVVVPPAPAPASPSIELDPVPESDPAAEPDRSSI